MNVRPSSASGSVVPAIADSSRPELSIVIPCFNEEHRLPPTLHRILDYLAQRGLAAEVVVVDDGSSDRTSEIVTRLGAPALRLLRLPHNQGKGAAVRAGVLASTGARILISDADLSTPIEEIEKLETRMAEAEIAIGSRATADSEITRRQRPYRELMGKAFNRILRLVALRGIGDTQCGFKLLDGDIGRALFSILVTPGFAFDVELLWLARRQGYRIAEVGVRWENSPISRVHPLRDPPRMLLEVARFRWAHRRLKPARSQSPSSA